LRRGAGILFVALAVSLVAASSAVAGVNRWTSHGPRAGWIDDLAVHPTRPRTVFADTSAGLFKTVNGGRRWRPLPGAPAETALVAGFFAISHQGSGTVYLALEADENTGEGNGVFRSHDQGRTWEGPFTEGMFTRFNSIAIDPKRPGTLYVGQFHDFGLYKSTDAGESWSFTGNFANVGPIAIHPVRSRTLYVAGSIWPDYENGIFKSSDGGEAWAVSYPEGGRHLAIAPSRPATVYAATNDGIIVTTNGGATWRKLSSTAGWIFIQGLVVDPTRARTVYASIRERGVMKSVDGGKTWQALNMGLPSIMEVGKLVIDPTGRTLHLALRDSREGEGVSGIYDYTNATRATHGDDLLLGTRGVDVFRALAGNDRVRTLARADRIHGGRGDDRINPGIGRDMVFSGQGSDLINVRDRRADAVACGGGFDTVRADRRDSLARSCEVVSR
jgi:photosystem II stability/assembly factor-like uncharacterized protein